MSEEFTLSIQTCNADGTVDEDDTTHDWTIYWLGKAFLFEPQAMPLRDVRKLCEALNNCVRPTSARDAWTMGHSISEPKEDQLN